MFHEGIQNANPRNRHFSSASIHLCGSSHGFLDGCRRQKPRGYPRLHPCSAGSRSEGWSSSPVCPSLLQCCSYHGIPEPGFREWRQREHQDEHLISSFLTFNKQLSDNPDSILKNRDINLPTKVHLVKPMVFPTVTYRRESWTLKKAEHQRIDAFELWCWRRLLRVPWTARRSNQSIPMENSPEYSLEGLMLKLKLQYFGHLMWRTDSLEKTLMLAKTEGGRGRGQQRMRQLDGITDSMDEFEQALGVVDGQRSLACCSSWGRTRLKSRTRLSDWTDWLQTFEETQFHREYK